MKRLGMTFGILTLAIVLAGPVFGHRVGWDRRSHAPGDCSPSSSQCDNLTEDQRAEMDKLEKRFHSDTSELRAEIGTKTEALDSLLNASDPDPKKVKALQNEISDLEAKMAQKRIDLELEARKIAPNRGHGYRCGTGCGKQMKGCGSQKGC